MLKVWWDLNDDFIANFLGSVSVKYLTRYGQEYGVAFFLTHGVLMNAKKSYCIHIRRFNAVLIALG